jgi:hypothetical protein
MLLVIEQLRQNYRGNGKTFESPPAKLGVYLIKLFVFQIQETLNLS